MATYELISASRVNPHRHITRLGTSDGRKWTVDEVRAAIRAGVVFHTRSPTTTGTANVIASVCRYCGFAKVRSAIDAASDNDLDALPNCE